MIIKSIKLVNFRNHSEYKLECTDETSLILGNNGCGKTSVLEAIYILMRGKSFRATDKDILKHGEKFYRIEVEFLSGEKNIAVYDGEVKTFNVMEKKYRRLPKKNRYPVVLFLPSDLNLISNSPSSRRDYFDVIFGQFSNRYDELLPKYEKVLKQRNELLKNETVSTDMVFSWNILLSRYGVEICRLRQEFVEGVNQRLTTIYRSIAENDDVVELEYETQVGQMSEGEYLKQLENDFQKDLLLRHTSFGVHRDDFIFKLNHKVADGSASRGEARSIILALKFIEAEMITEKTKMKPLVLLDDVFSELDDIRQKCLVQNFKNNQVIITSVK